MRAPTLALLGLLTAAPALALGPVAFGPDPAAAGWQTLTFRGRAPARFAAEGANTLRFEADGGVAVLYRPLPRDFAEAARASWRWRVDAGVPPTDLGTRGADDRSIALYFLFADDPATLAAPPASLRAAMAKGRALVYVWGGDAAAGSVIASPQMFGRGKLVVLRPAAGAAPGWQTETVDLRADFRRAFGRAPGPLMAVAVSTDSDDTGTRVRAAVADLELR